MLYVTAEMLGTGDFYDLVERMITNCTLKRIIVDEAHCISEWGSDFRPDYGRIGRYKESFPQLQFVLSLPRQQNESRVIFWQTCSF